jgi:CheY-specific phosphatase CheX
MSGLKIDQTLLECVIQGTIEGISMTGITPEPVGASRLMAASRDLSVLVSLQGNRNGQMTINLSTWTACFLAGKLMGEEGQPELSEDTFDAICELGNMVAGRFKDILHGTEYEFSTISLPALIAGANYNLYHTRNITTAAVEFEIGEISVVKMKDRFFTCSISLMKK